MENDLWLRAVVVIAILCLMALARLAAKGNPTW